MLLSSVFFYWWQRQKWIETRKTCLQILVCSPCKIHLISSSLKHWMKWCELREYKWNEYVTIAVNRNCENSPKEVFRGFNGIRTCGLCDSLRWSHTHFICIPAVHIISFSVSFLSRVDELNKLASLQYMGLHSSAGRVLQSQRRGHGFESRWSPEKLFSGYFRNCLNCDSLRWSHTHFIFLFVLQEHFM